MNIDELLEVVINKNASDLHLTVGAPPVIRLHGQLMPLDLPVLEDTETKWLIGQLLEGKGLVAQFKENSEIDFSYTLANKGRFRVNVFKQRESWAAALRLIGIEIPTMEQMGLPRAILQSLVNHTRGLILVSGPTGSGKSTTLATMVNYINEKYYKHILTLEEPIEFLHDHKKSLVNQREIGIDSQSYNIALRAALREDPDVILIGEMRDQETIATAITAAETGHLVLSSLHTMGAVATIDRIIDVFPSSAKPQIRMQLADILKGVISQQLVPQKIFQGRCVALEIMVTNAAITNLIREEKTHQIYSQIQTGMAQGMRTMEASLIQLYNEGKITLETASYYASRKEEFQCLFAKVQGQMS